MDRKNLIELCADVIDSNKMSLEFSGHLISRGGTKQGEFVILRQVLADNGKKPAQIEQTIKELQLLGVNDDVQLILHAFGLNHTGNIVHLNGQPAKKIVTGPTFVGLRNV